MHRYRYIHILTILLLSASTAGFSQTNFNSPFSLKGVGDLARNGVPLNSALGGISLGMRERGSVDYVNPASYSGRDSLSFVLNFGAQGIGSFLTSQNSKASSYDLNLNHLMFGFPILKNLGFAFGFVPYTYTGYTISEQVLKDDPLYNPDIGELEYLYKGEGGVTRFFAGTSIELFHHLSIGINFDYLFGEIKKVHTLYFLDNPGTLDPEMERRTIVSDFNYDIGLQYRAKPGENNHLVLGLVGGTNKKLNYSVEQLDYAVSVFSNGKRLKDTIHYLQAFNQKFTLPFYIGAGFTFSTEKWLVGVDYNYQDWSKSEIPFSKDKLVASHFIKAGAQFIPNPRDFHRYWKIVRYRLGGHYGNSYFEVNNNPLKDFGISFGAGFPIPLSRTTLNISWESGWRGSIEQNYVKQQYNIINFGISINSFWFAKRKYK